MKSATTPRFWHLIGWIVLFCLIGLTACQPRPVIPAPSLTPPPPTSVPTLQTDSPILQACNLAEQQLAMRPDFLPDWQALGIDTCYQVELILLDEGRAYQGTLRLTFTNTTAENLADLVLRTYPNTEAIYDGQMEIDSIRQAEQAISFDYILPDLTAVKAALPSPLAPGQTITLEIAFHGVPPKDFGGDTGYGIFNYNSSGPLVSLANSYPLMAVRKDGAWLVDAILPEGDAVISEIAFYQFDVIAPQGWQVVSTGSLVEEVPMAEGSRFRFTSGPVREFMLLASPAFQMKSRKFEDVEVRQWGLESSMQGWDEALQVTVDSLELFSQRFGPYPYKELDVVSLPLQLASGVEYPGLFLIQDELYTTQEEPHLLPTVVAHEAAHQWWYAVVGNDVLRDPWMDEALATFSAQLYQLTYNSPFYYGTNAYYEERVQALKDKSGDEPIAQPVAAFSRRGPAYATIVYLKGSLFYDALRKQIGAQTFDQALQAYYLENQYQIASPDSLLNSFETACACQLDDLYQDWGVLP